MVWLTKETRLELTPILGDGKKSRQTVKNNGGLTVKLPKENSFVLYSVCKKTFNSRPINKL
jgi:hypothetical protein